MKKLKYTGKVNANGERDFVPGYPAEDFECEDDKEAAELVKNSGIYEYEKPPKDKEET